MFQRHIKLGWVVGGLVFLVAQVSHAAPITIQNASFENAAGGTHSGVEATSPSSWLPENTSHRSDPAIPYAVSVETAAYAGKDGNNYLVLKVVPTPSPVVPSTTQSAWVPSVSLGTYLANTVYTLTVAQASSDSQSQSYGVIAMLADGVIAQSAATSFSVLNTANNASGIAFHDHSVTLDTAVDTSVVGKSISVRLMWLGQPGAQYTRYAYFDNVRLDAVTTTIPEPATLGLLTLGGLMMLSRQR